MCCEVPCLHGDEVTALRRAAAMAHTVAGIGLTLRAGGRTLATVVPATAHPSFPSEQGVQMSACGFRHAVAKAWTDHAAGQRVALVGQVACGLDVEWALHQPGAMLGFGGVRTQWAGHMVWAMASTLPPDTLTTVLDEAGDHSSSVLFLADGFEARMLRDELLDVSIVHIEAERVSVALVAAIDEVIRNFVATTATAELLEALAVL